jgi:uncharacterized membrane protein YhaH (DUF805 family)
MKTHPKPIGRLAFIGRLLASIIASVGLYASYNWALWGIFRHGHENAPVVFLLLGLWIVAFLFLVACFIRFAVVTRLISIGVSQWLALLLLIPYLGALLLLFLLFYPAKTEVMNDAVV